MSTPLLIVIGALILFVIASRLMLPSLAAEISKARESGDIGPIVDAIKKLRPGARTTAYNHAIRQLWDSFDRELAFDLIKDLARNHPEALITQYWLDHAQKVEPQIARRRFDRRFLERYYQPEVAAKCGPVG